MYITKAAEASPSCSLCF